MQLLDHDGEGPLHVRLPTDPTAPTETPAWDAVVIAISPLGDISEPVRARIVRDILAPGVTVDAPVATVPWPFTATVHGRSEPGSSVTVDGRPVHVAPDGQFEVDARLPPWPQRLRVEAVDRAGNSQAIEAELVGGFDYRQLPWVAILVGTLVAGGLVSVLRASGRSTLRQSSAWDDVPAPPIEEITTAEPTTRVHDPGPAR